MTDNGEVGSYNSGGSAENDADDSSSESLPKLGLILGITGVFLSSIASIISEQTKFSSKMNLILLQHSIHALIVIPYISTIRNSIEISRSSWKFMTLAGLLASLANILVIFTSYITPYSDQMFISYNSSIIVAGLAWCFLKEALTFFDALTISISVIGVFLTTTPIFVFAPYSITFEKQILREEYTYGMVSSLGICILVSVASVIIRHLRSCPATVIIAVQSILSVFFSFVLCLNYDELKFPPTANYWVITVLMSLLTLVARLAFIFALKFEFTFRIIIVYILHLPASIVFKGFSKNIDLKVIEVVGFALIIVSVLLLFIETTLRKVLRNYCGINIESYENMDQNSGINEPEETTLKKLLQRDKRPTLYSTD